MEEVSVILIFLNQQLILLNRYTDSANNFPSSIVIPRFIGKIGIPFGFDIAINYAKVPQSSIEFYGIGGQFILANPRVLPLSLSLKREAIAVLLVFVPFDANSTNAEALLGVLLPVIKPYMQEGKQLVKFFYIIQSR